jgi:hypothetical protein
LPWLLAARRKKLRHLQLLLLLKLRPLLLRLLMQSRLTPLLLLTLPSRLTPLLRLLTLSLLTLPLRPLMQSRLKPLRPSNLRIIFGKNRSQDRFFFVPVFRPCSAYRPVFSFISAALALSPSASRLRCSLIWRKRIRSSHKDFAAPRPYARTDNGLTGCQGPFFLSGTQDRRMHGCRAAGTRKNEPST